MFEILKKANEESLQRSKEMQKLIDEVGGWDEMVAIANESPHSMHKRSMEQLNKMLEQ